MSSITARVEQLAAERQARIETLPKRVREKLSPRQAEIVAMVAQGKTTVEIAEELGIALETTKHHIGQSYAKLRVRGRVGLILEVVGRPEPTPTRDDIVAELAEAVRTLRRTLDTLEVPGA